MGLFRRKTKPMQPSDTSGFLVDDLDHYEFVHLTELPGFSFDIGDFHLSADSSNLCIRYNIEYTEFGDINITFLMFDHFQVHSLQDYYLGGAKRGCFIHALLSICEIKNSIAIKKYNMRRSRSSIDHFPKRHFILGFDEGLVIECIAHDFSIEYDREAYNRELGCGDDED